MKEHKMKSNDIENVKYRYPKVTGGRRIGAEMAVIIFREVYSCKDTYGAIGKRYGVSRDAVGAIARGQVYGWMFRREMIPGTYDYYVSENREGAPRYRHAVARRGSRG